MRHNRRRSSGILGAAAATFLLASAAPAAEVRGYGLSVVVNGYPAAEYVARGRTYVEAMKGNTFTLRLTNPTGERVAVAVSVDGRNVVDARHTTAREATKWILEPWQTLEIPGWQISGETSRRFFFTETGRSYAKWLGDTSNVGTIEAAFFRERRRRPIALEPKLDLERPRAQAERPEPDAQSGARDGAAPPSAGTAQAAPKDSVRREAPAYDEPDRYAATGIGERQPFPIQWVDFQADPTPVTTLSLRYEFRTELVRLGVLPEYGGLAAREGAQGFERRYAPSPR